MLIHSSGDLANAAVGDLSQIYLDSHGVVKAPYDVRITVDLSSTELKDKMKQLQKITLLLS